MQYCYVPRPEQFRYVTCSFVTSRVVSLRHVQHCYDTCNIVTKISRHVLRVTSCYVDLNVKIHANVNIDKNINSLKLVAESVTRIKTISYTTF